MSWGRVEGRRVMELGSPGPMRAQLGHRRFWAQQGAEVREDSEVACLWFHLDPPVTGVA